MHRHALSHPYLNPHGADQLPQQPLHLYPPPHPAIPHGGTSYGVQPLEFIPTIVCPSTLEAQEFPQQPLHFYPAPHRAVHHRGTSYGPQTLQFIPNIASDPTLGLLRPSPLPQSNDSTSHPSATHYVSLQHSASLPQPNDSVSHPFTAHYGSLQHPPATTLPSSHNSGAWVVATPGSSHTLVSPRVLVSGWAAAPQPVSASVEVPSQYEWTAEPQSTQNLADHGSLSKKLADHGSLSKKLKRDLKSKRVKKRRLGKLSALRVLPAKPVPTMTATPTMTANLDQPITSAIGPPTNLVVPVDAVPTVAKMKPLERGTGWCPLCQRDCVTVAMLQRHMVGKNHRKQLHRQKGVGKVIVPVADTDQNLQGLPVADTDKNLQGVPVKDVFEQIWQKICTTGQECVSDTPESSGEQDVDGDMALAAVMSDHDEKGPIDELDIEEGFYNSATINGPAAVESCEMRKEELTRCELCNVHCDTKEVLEIHFTGKKHASRLRNSQIRDRYFHQ